MFNIEKYIGDGADKLSQKMSVDGWKESLPKNEVKTIAMNAQNERALLGESLWDSGMEWGESILGRFAPKLAKYAWAIEGGFDYMTGAEEDVPWEQEMKMAIGITGLIPDFMLKPFTDRIKKPIVAILESGFYPGGEKLAKKINDNDDPDDLIETIAIINQDIMTGKVTLENAWTQAIGNIPMLSKLAA